MRVLYVLERYPELSQTFVAQEILGLQAQGIDVDVAALARGVDGDEPANAVVAADFGPAARLGAAASLALTAPVPLVRQLTREPSWPPPGGRRRLRGALRIAPLAEAARRSDHIHAHFATEAADVARLLAAASRRPWSFTAHGVDAYSDRSALRRNLHSASFARACSDHVASRLRDAAPQPDAKIHEIGVAIDLDRFAEPHKYADHGPIIGVGRLVEKKGFDDLIAACSQASQFLNGRELVIVGDGPLRPQLEAQAAAADLPVRFTGSRSNADVAELMSKASMFALTPRTADDGDRDGRPAAIIEAMASGLPVVSTSQPGIPGLVDAESGRLAAPGDRSGIADAISEVLSMPEAERYAMGRHGQSVVRDLHSRDAVAQRLISLFRAG